MKFAITTLTRARAKFKYTLEYNHLFKSAKPYSSEISLLGRLIIAEQMNLSGKMTDNFIHRSLKSFKFKNIYWSLSHKGNFIATAINTTPIGIDIEICDPKNIELFNIFSPEEWKKLGRKSWKNFYLGWTTKEACLKKMSLNLEQMKDIIISGRKNNTLLLRYKKKEIAARAKITGKIICSVSQ